MSIVLTLFRTTYTYTNTPPNLNVYPLLVYRAPYAPRAPRPYTPYPTSATVDTTTSSTLPVTGKSYPNTGPRGYPAGRGGRGVGGRGRGWNSFSQPTPTATTTGGEATDLTTGPAAGDAVDTEASTAARLSAPLSTAPATVPSSEPFRGGRGGRFAAYSGRNYDPSIAGRGRGRFYSGPRPPPVANKKWVREPEAIPSVTTAATNPTAVGTAVVDTNMTS